MEFINNILQCEGKELATAPFLTFLGSHIFMLLLFLVRLNWLGPGSFGIVCNTIGYALHGAAQIISCLSLWYLYNDSGSFVATGICLCISIGHLCLFVKLCN